MTLRLPESHRANAWETLPAPLSGIRGAIERSREILQWHHDWDDSGSPAIEEDTWVRAVDFLARYAAATLKSSGKALQTPRITPGPDGSIDLHWDQPDYECLINIPADDTAMAGFYGDDRGRASIKGRFDPGQFNEGLLSWLQKAS